MMTRTGRRCGHGMLARVGALGGLTLAAWLLTGSAALADGGGGNPCLPHDAVADQAVVELFDTGSIDDVMAAVLPLYPEVSIAVAFPESGLFLLNVPDPICEAEFVQFLLTLPGIEEAEFNETGESVEGQTQSFFFASSEFAFDTQYTWPKIHLIDAQTESLGEGVLIAVIDSGVDTSHPIFAQSMILPGIDFVGDGQGMSDFGNGTDDDGDGAIDELAGHGTYITSLMATIAPQATILPLRAIDTDGRGTVFAIAAALVEAHNQGADIINLSFGTAEDIGVLQPLLENLLDEGVLVVVSAGNGGQTGQGPFPASMSGVCAIAATDADDVKASFSNAGGFVSLCAPGVGIVGAFPGGGYVVADGTSVSAAIVSGTAALVISKDACDGEVAHLTVEASADPIADKNPKGTGLGAGRVNAGSSVDAVPVPGDFDADRKIDGDDLAVLIGAWGTPLADISGDGTTDMVDLSILIGGWTG